MKKFALLAILPVAGGLLVAILSITVLAGMSTGGILPKNYRQLSAEQKQTILWEQGILPTQYKDLPPLTPVSPLKLLASALWFKVLTFTDEAPQGYEKSLHAHGVVAKVKFEPEPGTAYTGLFQGADFGLLRLSVTGDPEGEKFAPGMALKLLIDGHPSQNVSALYTLSGQGKNHNFLANELSNVVPVEFAPDSLAANALFLRVTRSPTKMSVVPFGERTQQGEEVAEPKAPAQLYFVPTEDIAFDSTPHDFREDLLNLPPHLPLYEVYATDEAGNDFGKIDRERRDRAIRIGRLITTSEFVASEFGDDRLFFKHNRLEGDGKMH